MYYYFEDHLGTSRVVTNATGTTCYDADFYPFGGERVYTNTCPQNYKFTGKERDAETGNDDFGGRYYSNRFGRWLSADWSSVPAPVPYANFANPQTLNLYAMVSDDPESFADLDGHCCWDDIKSFAVGVAKELHNMAADTAAHGFQVAPSVAPMPLPAAVGEANGLTGMGTGGEAQPVIQSPSNGMETAGTVTTAVAPLVLATAGSTLAGESSESATTTLFRAVGSREAQSIADSRAFSASPTGSTAKGFFFNEADAQRFANMSSQRFGDVHSVVSTEAPTELAKSSTPHTAAQEGPGVYIRNEDLNKLTPPKPTPAQTKPPDKP